MGPAWVPFFVFRCLLALLFHPHFLAVDDVDAAALRVLHLVDVVLAAVVGIAA